MERPYDLGSIRDLLSRTDKDSAPRCSTEGIFNWAKRNIYLPNSYAKPGRFSVDSSKYLIEPFEAIREWQTHTIVIYKAVQTAGTLLADIAIPWYISNRPGPIMFCQATDEMASEHFLGRLLPIIQRCPSLKGLVPDDLRLHTKGGINFPHMQLFVNGAKESALQSKSIQFFVADETWLYSIPLDWVFARVSAFRRVGSSKVLIISQPGQENDQTDSIYKQGTMERLAVPCNKCGKHFILEFNQLKWDTNDTTKPEGKYDFLRLSDTIRLECPICGHPHKDSAVLKSQWNNGCKFIVTNSKPTTGIRSFHWGSLHIERWSELVEQFLRSKEHMNNGNMVPLITFVQQKLAEPKNEEKIADGGDKAAIGEYDIKSDWADEVARFCTIDVQKTCYWMEVRAWAADGRSRQLYYGNVPNEESIKGVINDLKVPANCVFVDVGFEWSMTHSMIARNNWVGIRGSNNDYFTHLIKAQRSNRLYSPFKFEYTSEKKFSKWMFIASNACRDILANLRDGKGPEFLSLDNPDYHRQLFGEIRKKVIDKATNRTKWVWYKIRDNHSFDCSSYQVSIATMHPKIRFSADLLPASIVQDTEAVKNT